MSSENAMEGMTSIDTKHARKFLEMRIEEVKID